MGAIIPMYIVFLILKIECIWFLSRDAPKANEGAWPFIMVQKEQIDVYGSGS